MVALLVGGCKSSYAKDGSANRAHRRVSSVIQEFLFTDTPISIFRAVEVSTYKGSNIHYTFERVCFLLTFYLEVNNYYAFFDVPWVWWNKL